MTLVTTHHKMVRLNIHRREERKEKREKKAYSIMNDIYIFFFKKKA